METTLGLLAVGLALLLVFAILAGLFLLSSLLYEKWRDLAEHDYELLALQPIGNDRLLILRTVGDEATAATAATRFVGWVVSMAYEGIFKIVAKISTIFFWPFLNLDKVSRPHLVLIVLALALGLVGYFLILVVSLLVCVPVLIVMALTAINGIGFARTSMFLEFSAESTPAGFHDVFLCEADGASSALVHSESYRHSPAIEKAAEWIAEIDAPSA